MEHYRLPKVARYFWPLGLIAVLGVAALVLSAPAFGQVATGSLSGTVYDVSGAVIPGADVALTNEATKVANKTTSDSAGYFSYPFLLPGSYTVTISAKGFTTWEQRNVAIATGESRTLPNIALKVAGAVTTVEVVSAAQALAPVDTGESSATLRTSMVSEIGIMGRDAAELIKILPGVAIASGLGQAQWNSLTTASNSGPVGNYSASGTQPYGALQFTMDGGVIIDTGNMGTQIANVNQDQTAELTIRNSAFDAEYTHGPVTINATSKTGGSAFHGEAYTYARGATFNAVDSNFKSHGIAKPNDHYWYPGGNIGGPILIPGTDFNKGRDKLFFFAGFEYMIQHPEGAIHEVFVPTANMLNGSFTAADLAGFQGHGFETAGTPCGAPGDWNYPNFCKGAVDNGTVTLYEPSPNTTTAWTPAAWDAAIAAQNAAVAAGCGTSGKPACPGYPTASGATVSSVIDPIGKAYMNLFPKANIDPASHQGYNWMGLDHPPVNRWELKLRGDYNVTPNSRLYLSYNRQHETDVNNYGIWWVPTSVVPYPSSFPATQISDLWSAGFTHVFGPTLTNETTFNFTSFINPITFANPAAVNPSKVGVNLALPYNAKVAPMIPNTFSYDDWGNGSLPMFWAPGFASTWHGGAFGALKRVPSIADNLGWVKSKHTLKFGFSWDRWGNQQTEGVWGGNEAFPQGSYEFDVWANQSTSNPMADMLLGRAANFNQYAPDEVHTLWFTEAAAYAQDHWKATRRLSLDLGIRLDHEGQWAPGSNTPGVPVWDPALCTSTAPGPKCVGASLPGFTWHSINSSIPISGLITKFVNPDPRVGAAYDLFGNGKTVLRGGFGVYRYQWAYNSIPLDPPLGVQFFTTSCAVTGWAQAVSSGCTGPLTPVGQLPASSTNLGETAVDMNDNKTPYTQNWNIVIDRRVMWNSLFSIGYNGSRTRNELIGSNSGNNADFVPIGGYFQPDPVVPGANYCILPYYHPAGCTGNGLPAGTSVHFLPVNYSSVQVNAHKSYANYNALQLKWEKQAGRATFMFNYTWSKVMGIRDGETDNGIGNGANVDPYNMAANYGVLDYDRTHVFNAAYVIHLPDPVKGNSFGDKIGKGFVNGWELSGITQLQSGSPIQPNTGGNMYASYPATISTTIQLGASAGTMVPILTCDPRKGVPSGAYFNVNCFAPPTAQGSFGNIIWPYIRGPAYFDSDLGLYKNFKVTERQTLQLRFQAFNFLNHPLPDFTLGGNDYNLSFNQSGCNYQGFAGLCASNVNASTTGKPTFTQGRRVMEFSIKYMF